ncbi:dirigent protein 24-like [Neltuma alba]|uniref:dirigent protein 24-like n=1 Tax=Neltuma alba TaxID=207710 RepID=UPI0010A41477|nr:dirigent protein 24-like [Prosopis alba]XP_028805146.1 dirigent protein 24-like [Prosopis alba]
MSKLPSVEATIAIFLSFMASFMNQSCSARTLTDNIPNHNLNLNLNHSHLHKITFLMPHVLDIGLSQSSSASDFVFSKPQGISPDPTTGIPVSESSGDDQTQTLDLSSMGFLFPTNANLQDLELRKITLIQQELLQQADGSLGKIGKAEGVYVDSSEDHGSSYMIALTVSFGEDDDGLRLFGEQRNDVLESHVAVIGGTGKYEDANGYASIKVVERVGFSEDKGKVTSTKLLSFDVYLI